jgi:hypothetical protein
VHFTAGPALISISASYLILSRKVSTKNTWIRIGSQLYSLSPHAPRCECMWLICFTQRRNSFGSVWVSWHRKLSDATRHAKWIVTTDHVDRHSRRKSYISRTISHVKGLMAEPTLYARRVLYNMRTSSAVWRYHKFPAHMLHTGRIILPSEHLLTTKPPVQVKSGLIFGWFIWFTRHSHWKFNLPPERLYQPAQLWQKVIFEV